MEDKCLICHGTKLNNLVKINMCCGVQIVHTECLHEYLKFKKTCLICHKDISDRLSVDTKYQCEYSFICGLFLIIAIIATVIANGIVMNNLRKDYYDSPPYKFGLAMFVIGNIVMGFLWLFGGLFICNAVADPYADDSGAYPIIKISDKYYLWGECNCQSEVDFLPQPCGLTKKPETSVFMAKCIIGYSMGISNVVANLILTCMYYNDGDMSTALWLFGGAVSVGLSIPLFYLVIYPLFYAFSFVCFKKKQILVVKNEYITTYRRDPEVTVGEMLP